MRMLKDRLPKGIVLDLALIFLALGGYGVSLAQLDGYASDIGRQQVMVPGSVPTPALSLTPSQRRGNAIAIIVHGYSGSKETMLGFGIELAKMGIPSYLIDLPGHGASQVALDLTDDDPQLQTALGEVVDYARLHSDVPHPRMIVIGHSLGSRVVGQFAATQPTDTVAATILVSPIFRVTPTTAHPANVLYLVGEHDLTGLLDLARDDMVRGCDLASADQLTQIQQSCGSPAQGTGRKLTVIPGANHISILTDAATFQAMDDWVAATEQLTAPSVSSNARLWWTVMVGIFAIVVLIPLIDLALKVLPLHVESASQTPLAIIAPIPLVRRLGFIASAVVGSVVILRGWSLAAAALGLTDMPTPLSWLHMALADEVGSLSFVLGVILWVGAWLTHRPVPSPLRNDIWAQLALGAGVAVGLYLMLGLPFTAEWDHLLLTAARLWRFLVLAIVNLPVFFAIEWLLTPETKSTPWRAVVPRLVALSLLPLGLVGAILLDHSLFFLSLLIPIQGALFVLLSGLAYQARRQGQNTALAVAIFISCIFSWLVAAIFPLI